MLALISRTASLLLAIGYVIAAGLSKEGLPFASAVALGALIPLALIWFPEEINDWFIAWRNLRYAALNTSPSPAWLIAAMGWALLVGVPLYVLLRH